MTGKKNADLRFCELRPENYNAPARSRFTSRNDLAHCDGLRATTDSSPDCVGRRGVIRSNALETSVACVREAVRSPIDDAYLVKSNPSFSSSRSSASASCFTDAPCLVGLATGDLRAGAGLLLGAISASALVPLAGLRSKAAPFTGVFPISAYFQKGAGELVGIC
jgi:hypothetical protein